jgi:hypothetical protein
MARATVQDVGDDRATKACVAKGEEYRCDSNVAVRFHY